jgi:hypothetical protein
MRRRRSCRVRRVVLAALALLAACHRRVALDPIASVPTAPLPLAATVRVSERTASYVYAANSFMAGGANQWDIEVGQAITQYADAYLAHAFEPGSDASVDIDLADFDIHDFEAHAAILFAVHRRDAELLRKTYECKGEGYAARVVWGGAFAMKSSMRQTTDEALRSCFAQFLADARAQAPAWAAPAR